MITCLGLGKLASLAPSICKVVYHEYGKELYIHMLEIVKTWAQKQIPDGGTHFHTEMGLILILIIKIRI